MKKYYSLRTILAESESEAIEKVINQDFKDDDELCDKCMTMDEIANHAGYIKPDLALCREIEEKVLKVWHARAKAQGYKPHSKTATDLQAGFLFGMVAACDVIMKADETGQSSISPKVMLSVMRGDYIE